MKKLMFVLMVILAISCGKEVVYVPGPTVTEYVNVPAVPTPELELVMSEENDYRQLTGAATLTNGLTCSLYNFSPSPAPVGPPAWYQPSDFPATLPTAVASYTYVGPFNQPDRDSSAGINVLPPAFRSVYTQWYGLRCSGYVAITESDYYNFSITSDDASKLYLDNALLIDNGGNHGMQTRLGSKLLRRGVHQFRVDYMSGPGGSQGLIVLMNGEQMSSELFYR